MYNNVNILCVHNAQICFRINRLRSSEQNVGELGSGHGTAPSVGQTGTQRLSDQSFRLGRTSHMAHMQRAGYFPVDSTGSNLFSLPDFLRMLRSSLQEILVAEYFSVLAKSHNRHFMSQIIDIFPFGFYAPLFRDTYQLLRIFYLIRTFRFRMIQRMADLASMIGMRSRSGCRKLQIISSDNAMSVTSADSSRCFRGNTAGTHRTDPAADTLLTKLTVRGLIFYT